MHSSDNKSVASVLARYADLLELAGGDKYRFLAYRRAADAVRVWPGRVADLAASGGLNVIPGVGDKMVAVIGEILERGSFEALDELSEVYPASLTEVMRVPGVGRKRAVQLHERLGISSVDELEQAIADGRIERAGGFGVKTAEKMAQSLDAYRRHSERTPLAEALDLAGRLERDIESLAHAEKVALAGSIRRHKDTVGNIDLVAATGEPGLLADEIASLPVVDAVLSRDDRSIELRLYEGSEAGVRMVPVAAFGAALRYWTGDVAHNLAAAELAAKQGLELTERALMRAGVVVADEDEAAIFSAMGLPFMPPEVREGASSLEPEVTGRIVELVGVGDVMGDLQSHSTYTDGRGTLAENRKVCAELGYSYFAATDHAYDLRMVGGLDIAALERQWAEIDELNATRGEAPLILKGIELNIGEGGHLDYDDEVLARFDIVLASLHSGWDQDSKTVTARMLSAIAHPLIDVIAHPTGRVLCRRDPMRLDMEQVLAAAGETGTIMEVNSYPDRLDLSDEHLRLARRYGVRFSLGTDAHTPGHFRYMPYGVMQARRGLVTRGELINAWPWDVARTWLKRRACLGE
jgi:DNA polymerase (family 10)